MFVTRLLFPREKGNRAAKRRPPDLVLTVDLFPTGDPSEDYCFADISAAYSYLTSILQIPPSSIILYGRSLGSGPSCYLASRTAEEDSPVGGLILHAPFLSVYRIVLESGCTLPGDRFPNVDFAPSIRSPVLLIHGTKDSIVPFNHSERMLQVFHEDFRADPLFIKGTTRTFSPSCPLYIISLHFSRNGT